MERPSSRRSSLGSMPSAMLGTAVRLPICLREHLVHGGADVDVARIGADLRAGEHVGHAAHVRAGILEGELVVEPADEDQVLAEWRRAARRRGRTPCPCRCPWPTSSSDRRRSRNRCRRSAAAACWDRPSLPPASSCARRSGSDSIQGSARATPAPRKKWRRDFR